MMVWFACTVLMALAFVVLRPLFKGHETLRFVCTVLVALAGFYVLRTLFKDPEILFACTVLVALAFFVLRPLFKDPESNLDLELLSETELDRLLDRKAVIYSNLKDLEFEHKMGRLSDTDFRQLDAGYKNEAAVMLQRLDQLNASENLDAAIEKDIAARKAKSYGSVSTRTEGSPRCPSCGAEIISGKKYCADCGHRL